MSSNFLTSKKNPYSFSDFKFLSLTDLTVNLTHCETHRDLVCLFYSHLCFGGNISSTDRVRCENIPPLLAVSTCCRCRTRSCLCSYPCLLCLVLVLVRAAEQLTSVLHPLYSSWCQPMTVFSPSLVSSGIHSQAAKLSLANPHCPWWLPTSSNVSVQANFWVTGFTVNWAMS